MLIARSSNGRTTDSESVYLGSNPSLAAKDFEQKLFFVSAGNGREKRPSHQNELCDSGPNHSHIFHILMRTID